MRYKVFPLIGSFTAHRLLLLLSWSKSKVKVQLRGCAFSETFTLRLSGFG
ncbi:MAG: hypothetical protein ACI9LM_002290 [Alteromonadaceae bacterium]